MQRDITDFLVISGNANCLGMLLPSFYIGGKFWLEGKVWPLWAVSSPVYSAIVILHFICLVLAWSLTQLSRVGSSLKFCASGASGTLYTNLGSRKLWTGILCMTSVHRLASLFQKNLLKK